MKITKKGLSISEDDFFQMKDNKSAFGEIMRIAKKQGLDQEVVKLMSENKKKKLNS